MRPILFIPLLTILLASPAVLAAQPGAPPAGGPGAGPGFGPGGPHHGPGHGFFDEETMDEFAARRVEMLADYLELSEPQRNELEAIVEAQRSLREADREQFRDKAEALHDLLASEAPDATEVGRLVIDLHRGKESQMVQRAAERQKIEALLTPDQLDRFQALEAARQMRPPHRPFHDRPGPGSAPPAPEDG